MEFINTPTEMPQEVRVELTDCLVSIACVDEFNTILETHKHYSDSAAFYGTLIQYIIRKNHKIRSYLILPMIQALLDAGADPNINTDDYLDCEDSRDWGSFEEQFMPIHLVFKYIRDIDYEEIPDLKYNIIKMLLDHGVSADSRDAFGRTPLHYVCSYLDRTDIMQLLLDRGADINARDSKGRTPLYSAVDNYCLHNTHASQMSTVRFLLEHGAILDIRCKVWRKIGTDPVQEFDDGPTALYEAVLHGNLEVVRLLLDSGANLDDYVMKDAVNDLMQYAHSDYSEIIGLLREHERNRAEMCTWFKRAVIEDDSEDDDDVEEDESEEEDEEDDDAEEDDDVEEETEEEAEDVEADTNNELFPFLEEVKAEEDNVKLEELVIDEAAEYQKWKRNEDIREQNKMHFMSPTTFDQWMEEKRAYVNETNLEMREVAEERKKVAEEHKKTRLVDIEAEFPVWRKNKHWFKRGFREWIKEKEEYERETERERWEAAEEWLGNKYKRGYDCRR